MELPAMRSLKLALSVNTTGDASASVPADSRRSGRGGSSFSSSVSSASSVTGSPDGRRDAYEEEQDDDEELRSYRSNASSSSRSAHDAQLNLPLDKEFVPLAHHDDEEDEEEKAREDDVVRDQMRDDVIRMIFDLPHTTKFYQDFSCAIAATLAMHGRMYPTDTHVCFYSNVFGRERKILIPYESISEIAKTTTMVFQNAIRIATTAPAKEEYTFTSFWGTNRDGCYDLIVKTRNRVLNDLKPAVVRGLQRTGVAIGSTNASGDDADGGVSSSPVTSPMSTRSAKAGAVAAALAEHHQQHNEETDDADSDADNAVETDASFSRQEVMLKDQEKQTQPQQQQQNENEDTHEPVRRSSVVSDIGSAAPKDISMTQIVEETFDVSVEEFMGEFFWDDAKFGLDEFGTRQGYTEMKCNPWMTPLEDDVGMTRSLQFRVPVDAPIGPKSSRVDVLQCAKNGEKGARVIETSTRLVDIPYGDYFSVEDRWTLLPASSSNPKSCKLFIELKVVFSKSTFWKSKIETRAIADNKTKWLEWVQAAKQHLVNKEKQQRPNTAAVAEPASSTPKSSERLAARQQSVEGGRESRHSQLASSSQPNSSSSARTAPKRRSSRASSSHRAKQQQQLLQGQASLYLSLTLLRCLWLLLDSVPLDPSAGVALSGDPHAVVAREH